MELIEKLHAEQHSIVFLNGERPRDGEPTDIRPFGFDWIKDGIMMGMSNNCKPNILSSMNPSNIVKCWNQFWLIGRFGFNEYNFEFKSRFKWSESSSFKWRFFGGIENFVVEGVNSTWVAIHCNEVVDFTFPTELGVGEAFHVITVKRSGGRNRYWLWNGDGLGDRYWLWNGDGDWDRYGLRHRNGLGDRDRHWLWNGDGDRYWSNWGRRLGFRRGLRGHIFWGKSQKC